MCLKRLSNEPLVGSRGSMVPSCSQKKSTVGFLTQAKWAYETWPLRPHKRQSGRVEHGVVQTSFWHHDRGRSTTPDGASCECILVDFNASPSAPSTHPCRELCCAALLGYSFFGPECLWIQCQWVQAGLQSRNIPAFPNPRTIIVRCVSMRVDTPFICELTPDSRPAGVCPRSR